VVAVAILVVAAPGIGHAQARALDRIGIATEDGSTVITIRLQTPMRYVSHSPGDRGELLRFEVRPMVGALPAERESLSGKDDDRTHLRSVEYEPDGTDHAEILVQFSKTVSYEVRRSSDPRKLEIVLASGPTPAAAAPAPAPASAATASKTDSTGAQAPAGSYVVNLVSSDRPILLTQMPRSDLLDQHRVYTTAFEKDGRTWYRLRVGFFATHVEADFVAKALRSLYPQTWVAKPEQDERRTFVSIPPAAETAAKPPVTERAEPKPAPTRPAPTLPATSDDVIARVMDQARDAMTREDYSRAIALYTKVLQYPQNAYSQEALELLGLARERNGQLAHAKAEYEQYLAFYPDSEGSRRVQQRLDGLVTARKEPKEQLRKAKREERAAEWDTYGALSQFYRRSESFTDIEDRSVDESNVASDLTATGRRRSESNDLRAQLTGSYQQGLFEDYDADVSLNELYVDDQFLDVGFSARLGRQSLSTNGVLGRFDGGLIGYQLTPQVRVNAVGGFPTDTTTSVELHTNRYFYGLSMDLGTFADHWDFNVYAIEEMVDSLVDRRAVGGEVRYFDARRSLFGFVDYDVYYKELNTALLVANVTFLEQSTLSLTVDYRYSPILQTTNALQGQTANSINDLHEVLTSKEIRELARDRTARSKLFTISGSQPLNSKLQLSGDFTVSDISGTPASTLPDGTVIEAVPGTGYEYFWGAQLIGSNIIKEGDVTIFGVRYADADTTDTLSFNINTRYPYTQNLRFNPRLRFDWSDNTSGGTQYILRGATRWEYRLRRSLRLELEIGGEWQRNDSGSAANDSFGYFVNVGYRWDF